MNLQDFLVRRQQLQEKTPQYRDLCNVCIQPRFSCYCSHIQRFDPQIDFVILIHPIEVRRRIATGRMSHLALQNSYLIRGQDYSQDAQVNQLLADTERHCVILYPGMNSTNLTPLSMQSRQALFPKSKKLTIFVIDGTWLTAKKMMRQSQNLIQLPRICFSPPTPSNFRVRKQPHPACYSTIEAIHHTIELIGSTQGFNTELRTHDRLLNAFDKMVELQLSFIEEADRKCDPKQYRKPRKP